MSFWEVSWSAQHFVICWHSKWYFLKLMINDYTVRPPSSWYFWKHKASTTATPGLIIKVRHWATQQEQTETHLPENIRSQPVSVRQSQANSWHYSLKIVRSLYLRSFSLDTCTYTHTLLQALTDLSEGKNCTSIALSRRDSAVSPAPLSGADSQSV